MSNEIDALAEQAALDRWPSAYDYAERDAYREGYATALRQLQAENAALKAEVEHWKKLHTDNCKAYDSACAEREWLRDRVTDSTALKARVEALEGALDPDQTKAAYMGEFAFPVEEMDEDGNEYTRKQYVPWTTIKEIMAAILTRAAKGTPHAE